MKDVGQHTLDEIANFFETYKILEKRKPSWKAGSTLKRIVSSKRRMPMQRKSFFTVSVPICSRKGFHARVVQVSVRRSPLFPVRTTGFDESVVPCRHQSSRQGRALLPIAPPRIIRLPMSRHASSARGPGIRFLCILQFCGQSWKWRGRNLSP